MNTEQHISFVLGSENINLKVSYDGEGSSLVIRKPGVNIKESFSIKLK